MAPFVKLKKNSSECFNIISFFIASVCAVFHLIYTCFKLKFEGLRQEIEQQNDIVERICEDIVAITQLNKRTFQSSFGKTTKSSIQQVCNQFEQKFDCSQILSRYEDVYKLPTEEQGSDFEKQSEKPVLNCFPLHCPGGGSGNSSSKDKPTAKENTQPQCPQVTANHAANPGEGCRDNNGEDNGDGDDPNKPSAQLPKEHYHEFLVPLKNKDEVTKSSKEHPELFMNSKRKCLENDEPVTDQINGATREEHDLRHEDVIGMSVTEANGEDSEHESINDSDYETALMPSGQTSQFPGCIPVFDVNGMQPKILYPLQEGLCLSNMLMNPSNIGGGGSGTCYKVLDICSQKNVAVKKVKSKGFRKEEIQIWSKFSSPNSNIVHFLGAVDDGAYVYMFMELLWGNLSYIAVHRVELGITEKKVAAIIKPVLQFLARLHKEGYVHGDIKPENILCGNNIKVADFGNALSFLEGWISTLDHGIHGTPPYMARELFCGGEYRPSIDIYAVACTMIYLSTGRRPWDTYQKDRIIFAVGSGKTPPLPEGCSEEMKKLLQHMLHPDHEQRPTANQVLKDPIFLDTPGSRRLDQILQDVLVDAEMLKRGVVPVEPQVSACHLAHSPMALCESDDEMELSDHSLCNPSARETDHAEGHTGVSQDE